MKRLGGTITGALSNLAAQGIPFFLLLFVTPLLLASQGRDRYGALILFNLVPQIAGQLDLGLATAATRGYTQYVARRDPAGAKRIFAESFALLSGWGFVLATFFYACHPAVSSALQLDRVVDNASPIYVAVAISILLSLVNTAILVPLRAVERYGLVARVQIVVGVVYWTCAAYWSRHGGSLTQLVTLGPVTVGIGTLMLHLAARGAREGRPEGTIADAVVDVPPIGVGEQESPMRPALPEAPDVGTKAAGARTFLLRPFLSLGAGAFVAQASSLATFHADKLLISALISPAAAGGYAICTNIANKILLIVSSGATFTFPRSARFHAEGDLERVAATYAFGTRMATLIAIALATPLVALAPAFLRIWIGADFAADHAATLRLLTIGYAITAVSVVASNVAVGIGEVALPAFFALLGGTITLIAVAVLAPRYGATGAATAAVIGMTQALVFNALIAQRIGGAAPSASWPLVWRGVAVAVPVALLGNEAGRFVGGWLSLFAIGGIVLALFVALWMSTFGRVVERNLLRDLVIRTRRATPL